MVAAGGVDGAASMAVAALGKVAAGPLPPLVFVGHCRSGKPRVVLTVRWETLSVLEAARRMYGLPQHVAQTCTAMLSEPGGLFLDVKSAFSKAVHLRQFASTLAGIGVHVKVGPVCYTGGDVTYAE